METSEDERIRGEDKKVSFSNLNPGSPTPSLRDPDSGSGNNEIEAISDQIPGIAPRQRTEQEATMFSTSEAGLTALVPLAPLTAPALQAPQSAKKPKHRRQWSQEREESPRKEIIAKRVVSLQELHRRRGLTLFQFFWEQGMNCGQSCSALIVRLPSLSESDLENAVPPDDHPFWHNDKDDFEPYENFWAPSRGPQWDDPIWHNDYDEETFQSFFNLNPGGPKPCFWNEDGSFSERVFRLFFDSIPGVASSSKDAEHIAAISGTTSASSQIASSSYSAWPPSAVPAIRKRNQYRPRRGNFKLLQDTGMPFPKLVNKIVPIDELHRRRSLTLLQFFQEMGMPSSKAHHPPLAHLTDTP